MRRMLTGILLALLWPALASAQVSSRWYTGATLASNRVTADPIDTGVVGAAGAAIGVRLTPAISLEFDLNHGFGKLSRTYEGIGISFAPANSTREEIERLGVLQRFERDWTPKAGFQGLVVWRDPTPRRVTAAAFAGVSGTWYRERYATTSLRFPPGVDPNQRSLQPSRQVVTNNRGGLVGGLMVPIKVSRDLSIAPEVRYTYGSIGDEIYNVFGSGVRMLWRF